MRAKLIEVLAVTASLATLVLVLAAMGLLPAREPDAPVRERLDPSKAVAPGKGGGAMPRAALAELELWRFPLCAPGQGARLYEARLAQEGWGFLAWCQGGYALYELGFGPGQMPTLTQVARFKARVELPGGVAAGDFDGDGQRDLVLAVAPRPGVVHRSGAGAFFLRGRAEGGYEAARPLAETPVVALAAQARTDGAGDSLFVLTRGDRAAQLPGQLWLFQHHKGLVRRAAVPTATGPRDLLIRSAGDSLQAWIVSDDPGALLRIDLVEAEAGEWPRRSLPLRGAQGWVHSAAGHAGALLARGAQNIYRLDADAEEISVSTYAEDVRVGPSVQADIDGDGAPELFGAVEGGVAWISGAGGVLRAQALGQPVLDVGLAADRAGRLRPVALIAGGDADDPALSLVVMPAYPWADEAPLSWADGEMRPAAGMFEVSLQ